jgi:hypothetical protein
MLNLRSCKDSKSNQKGGSVLLLALAGLPESEKSRQGKMPAE